MWLMSLLALLLGLSAFAPAWADGGQSAILDTVDLTGLFHTKTPWTLVIQQGAPDAQGDPAPVLICFRHAGLETCRDDLMAVPAPEEAFLADHIAHFVPPSGNDYNGVGFFNQYGHYEIIHTVQQNGSPVLAIYLSEFIGGPYEPLGPVVLGYRRDEDKFEHIFTGVESGNYNGEARVVADGPLAGDIAEDYESFKSPYPYRISFFRLTAEGHYVKALDYFGRSQWGDGNELGVIDAEMPAIMRRMGVWRAGQELPTPVNNVHACDPVVLKFGLEWCSPFASARPRSTN